MSQLSTKADPALYTPLFDGRELRNLLGNFATGVTVITTQTAEGRYLGLTANSFSAVSLDPPLILWSLRKNSPHLAEYHDSEYFAIHFLNEKQRVLSDHFSRPADDKFADVSIEQSEQGPPLLPDSLATLLCQNNQQIDAGDHVIFLGEIKSFSHQPGLPLLFFRGAYHSLGEIHEKI